MDDGKRVSVCLCACARPTHTIRQKTPLPNPACRQSADWSVLATFPLPCAHPPSLVCGQLIYITRHCLCSQFLSLLLLEVCEKLHCQVISREASIYKVIV